MPFELSWPIRTEVDQGRLWSSSLSAELQAANLRQKGSGGAVRKGYVLNFSSWLAEGPSFGKGILARHQPVSWDSSAGLSLPGVSINPAAGRVELVLWIAAISVRIPRCIQVDGWIFSTCHCLFGHVTSRCLTAGLGLSQHYFHFSSACSSSLVLLLSALIQDFSSTRNMKLRHGIAACSLQQRAVNTIHSSTLPLISQQNNSVLRLYSLHSPLPKEKKYPTDSS